MGVIYNRYRVIGLAGYAPRRGRYDRCIARQATLPRLGGGYTHMPGPVPNNPLVCKVAMIFAHDTRQVINTFHVARTTGWDNTSMTALATAVRNWWDTLYKAAVPASIALNQIQVRLYDPSNPLAVDMPVSPPILGTRPGTQEAGNVSLTMSERTGKAGRAHRGRMYVAGVSETDVTTDDRIGSALAVLVANAIANLVFGALPAGDLLAVFHRPRDVPHPLNNLYTIVNTYVVENIIDSQRRRLPGRGR